MHPVRFLWLAGVIFNSLCSPQGAENPYVLAVLPDTELELESMLPIYQATEYSLSTAYKSFLFSTFLLKPFQYSLRYTESY